MLEADPFHCTVLSLAVIICLAASTCPKDSLSAHPETVGTQGDDAPADALTLLQFSARRVRATPNVVPVRTDFLETPRIVPVGRMFMSTDPAASAQFFIDYFNAKPAQQNLTQDGECANVVEVNMDDGRVTLIFVQDLVSKHGFEGATAIETMKAEWESVIAQEAGRRFSPWEDFHDGFKYMLDNGEPALNIARALADGVKFQMYDDTAMITRLLVPYTAQTIEISQPLRELKGNYGANAKELVKKWLMKNPDDRTCRHNARVHEKPTDFWWKTVFASADLLTAADFFQNVFDATWHTPAPYPAPPAPKGKENCTLAVWMKLPTCNLRVHFVSSRMTWKNTSRLSIESWAKIQEEHRDLQNGKFDAHMYNNLILWADSLDPVVRRLRRYSYPFLALNLADRMFAVFVNIPQNGIAIQIRSRHLTETTPRNFSACNVSFQSISAGKAL